MAATSSPPRRARLRSRHAGLVLVAAASLFLALGACGDEGAQGEGAQGEDEQGAGRNAAPTGSDPSGSAGSKQAFDKAWWQRRVPVSLMLTGGQRGKFKACGCTAQKSGGLRRVAALLQRLRQRAQRAQGEIAAVGLGWSMQGNHEPQETAKAYYLRAVYEALEFRGVLLGAPDLTVSAMCQRWGPAGSDAPNVPLNVKVAETNPAAMESTPFLDVQIGGVSVRAVAVIGPGEARAMKDAGVLAGTMSVTQAFAGLQPQPERLWLVGADVGDAANLDVMRNALRRMGPCIIVDVGGRGLGRTQVDDHELIPGGDPLVLHLAKWGQAVGVIDLVPRASGGGWTVSYRHVELVPTWEKYGGALLRWVEALESLYRQMVRDEHYLADFPRGEDAHASFVGSSACARCHAAIYVDWKRSLHASALETLQAGGYQWDPECIRCHVVGWRRMGRDDWSVSRSAFRTPDQTAFLGGVGCESCHGPGSAHVQDPWSKDLFGADGPNRAKPGRADTCVRCHDQQNSHAFGDGFDTRFLPRVDHRGVPRDRRTIVPEALRSPK